MTTLLSGAGDFNGIVDGLLNGFADTGRLNLTDDLQLLWFFDTGQVVLL
jgi:hypothetical protein